MRHIKSVIKKIELFALTAVLTISMAMPVSAAKSEEMKQAEREQAIVTPVVYTGEELQFMGVINYDGYRWTWYSERVLPGGGLDIPGRHADKNGYICDEDGYICLASQDLAKGTEVDTPFGKKGKIYDVCGISGTLDVYVNW